MKKPKRKAAKKTSKKAKKATSAAAKKSAAKKSAKKVIAKRKTSPAKAQYPFNWHDLMTPDVDGAKRFYGEVVGWNFGHMPPDYHVLEVGGAGIGGIMAMPDHLKGMPPFWSGYVMVKNVDKACADVKKAGGAVHREPWDIPGTLRMAVVSDPAGAVFNIYHPLMQGGAKQPGRGVAGTVGWNELMTSDPDGSSRFYSKLFGWSKGGVHDMGPEFGKYHLLQVKKKDHAGLMKRPSFVPRDNWGFYFQVHGIDAAAKRITDHGGKITNGPMQVPTGDWIVSGQDPQGAHFSLMSSTK